MFKNININIFRSILAVIVIFIPLYPKFPLLNIHGTYVALRLDDIIIALAALIWLIYQIKNHFPFFKEKITPLFFLYFMAIIISFINAWLIYQTEPINLLLLHLLRRFEYISVFFITLESIKKQKDFSFIYVFFLISTLMVTFYGFGQKYLKFPVISTMNEEFSKGQLIQMNIWTRISSTFAGHYDLAAFLSVALIIILGVSLVTKNKILKISGFIIWLPAYYILALTASRVSTFAFLGGSIITLFLLKKYLWIIPVTGIVIFSIINSNDLNQRLLATIPALKNQFLPKNTTQITAPTPTPTINLLPTTTTTVKPITLPGQVTKPTPTIIRHQQEPYPIADADIGVARSGEIRFNAEWPRALNAWKRNIFVGSGLGSITLATDNDYLRCLGESGLLGFITFSLIQLFFMIKTLPLLFKKSSETYHSISIILFGGLLITLANAVFIDVFEASKTAYLFWIMMAIYYKSLNIQTKNDSD